MRKKTYVDPETGWKFTWEGGPHIEVFSTDAKVPFTNINVWDYDNDAPSIYPDEFRDRVRVWLFESKDDFLRQGY